MQSILKTRIHRRARCGQQTHQKFLGVSSGRGRFTTSTAFCEIPLTNSDKWEYTNLRVLTMRTRPVSRLLFLFSGPWQQAVGIFVLPPVFFFLLRLCLVGISCFLSNKLFLIQIVTYADAWWWHLFLSLQEETTLVTSQSWIIWWQKQLQDEQGSLEGLYCFLFIFPSLPPL